MKRRFTDLVDLAKFRETMDAFYRVTGVPHGILDSEDNIVSAVGWQDVCLSFHWLNARSLAHCQESNRYIAEHLGDGAFCGYACGNGLMDYAAPVVVDGEHLATIFIGQFLHEPPDLERFRAQARQLGFDEAAYLAAVARVPVIPRERVEGVMAFYRQLAEMLAAGGLDRLRQRDAEARLAELNAELAERVEARTRELTEKNEHLSREVSDREASEAAARLEKEISDGIINGLPGVFYIFDDQGGLVRWNWKLPDVTGYEAGELAGMDATEFFEGEDRARVAAAVIRVFEKGESFVEAELVAKGGRRIPYYLSGRRTLINGRPHLLGLGVDITERKVLEEELLRQTRTDLLTGARSRGYFFELTEREMARAHRYGAPLSLLMLDLDQFKAINDGHGHQVGDRVLQTLAGTCRDSLREVDIVGRIGGEEFAVLLPETGETEAIEAAERLRSRIEAAALRMPSGLPVHFTASFGVATLDPSVTTVDTFMARADQALYQAKRAGRNRVEAATPPAKGAGGGSTFLQL